MIIPASNGHDITEILLKVALNTIEITLTPPPIKQTAMI
jgi:hypothetical protein